VQITAVKNSEQKNTATSGQLIRAVCAFMFMFTLLRVHRCRNT